MNALVNAAAACVFVLSLAQAEAAEPSHPLDPLIWEEHWSVLKILSDADRIDEIRRWLVEHSSG